LNIHPTDKSFSQALTLASRIWNYRELIIRLSEREIIGRYRGSVLGIAWSVAVPLAMLAVYTFVFSQVFKAKWGVTNEGGSIEFAAQLFAGLITFNFFAECLNRGPTLITSNPSYVKRIVFPLEMLSCVCVCTALFQAIVSLCVLVAFQATFLHHLSAYILFLPLVWLPLILGTLSITIIISAAGVFLRDLDKITGVLLSMIMFLSPIFFPLSALPSKWLPILGLNPLAYAIEQTRRITVDCTAPSFAYIFLGTLLTAILSEWSFSVFNKIRGAFADVI